MTEFIKITPREYTGRSLFQLAILRFRKNKTAMVGSFILLAITLFSFFGPLLTQHKYDQIYTSFVSLPPSVEAHPKVGSLPQVAEKIAKRARIQLTDFTTEGRSFHAQLSSDQPVSENITRYFDRASEFIDTKIVSRSDDGKTVNLSGSVPSYYFLFGTDANGRDLMTRIMLGGQVSLTVGLLASLVSLGIGVLYGATAGYLGGRTDEIMMRVIEVLYSLPFVFLVVVLVVFFGRSFILIFLVIGAVEWLDMARIVRGQTLALKRRDFISAAESLGLTDWQIIRVHIIPNTLSAVIIFLTVVVPKVILLESFLSFLGLGVQAPLTSWGALIADGAAAMQSSPWLLLFPAIFFVLALYSLNFIGDGLRDALDPKEK
ncbi:ABC transporter permease subunit [Falsochrobactrum sp. TDYN1]|uniref:Oligopeptide transport system permease protein OppC n=1 Tax=Falsochrobactrum tianjinense TaxID=2706015 RepID=A0A949PNA1_9HYPH|nr:ABC transporter permease subunit [Falsochrobactrum sp. TDYN1]MBV2143792.1 ABC transporter permease subunit [Falsochrobactrum sp. TDYN1]